MSMSLPDFTEQTNNFTTACDTLSKELKDAIKNQKDKKVQDIARILQETKTGFNKVQNEFRKSVKLLKARIQFEENPTEAKKLENKLSAIKETYQALLTNMHTLKRTFKKPIKDLDKHILEATKALLSANRTIDLAKSTVKKLESREKIGTQKSVVNFEDLIDQLKSNSKLKNDCKTLMEIVSKLQFRNERITSDDIKKLESIKNNLTEDHASIKEWIDSITDQYNAAKDRMKAQFTALNELYLNEKGKHTTPEKYNKFLVKLHTINFQLRNNPIDFPIDCKEIDTLFSQDQDYVNLKSLLGYVQDCKNIKDSDISRLLSDRKLLAEAKLEGLKIIRNSFTSQNNQNDILISGAGPGGLMFGLMQAVQNRSFTILESRTKDSAQQRENILALGKEDDPTNLKMFQSLQGQHSSSADTKLLDFFGINDLLIADQRAFAKHVSEKFFQAKICDLQDAMLQRIAEIQETPKEDVIRYSTRIESIEVEKDNQTNPTGRAKVKLSGQEKVIEPEILLVSEGFQSTTRQLLGVGQTKESSKTRMAFSFFDNKEISKIEFAAKVQKTAQKLLLALKMLPFLIKHGFELYRRMKEVQDPLKALAEQFQRAMILLGTPQSDYMYLTLKPEEEKLIKDLQVAQAAAIGAFREQLMTAGDALGDKLNGNLKDKYDLLINQLSNPEQMIRDFKNEKKKQEFKDAVIAIFENADFKNAPALGNTSKINEATNLKNDLEKCTKKLADIEKEESQLVKNASIEQRDLFTLLYSRSPGSEVEFLPMDYKKASVVAAQVTAAEKNFIQASTTNCVIIGDAESTTDPISGSGFRTTILRAALLQSSLGTSLANPALSSNPINQGIFAWSSNQSSQSMREEGLSGRTAYRRGTEKIDRFLRVAKECKVLSDEQINQLKILHAKAKLMKDDPSIHFSEDDKRCLHELLSNLKAKYTAISTNEFSKDTEKNSLYIKATNIAQGKSKKQLTPDEIAIIREMNSEVATTRINDPSSPFGKNYRPEAWFMPLWLEIHEIQRLLTPEKK